MAPGLTFSVEDAIATSFPEASFDAVLEKGTLEALGAERDCELLKDEGCEMMPGELALVYEAIRLLKPGGVFVAITDTLPYLPEFERRGFKRMQRETLTE